MQREKSEVETWRDKWTLESTKTDGIKRECLQVCDTHAHTHTHTQRHTQTQARASLLVQNISHDPGLVGRARTDRR